MKTFILKFNSSHKTQLSRYVTMKAQAPSLERVLPRVKRIIEALNRLPNPYDHTNWVVYDIKEVGAVT